MFKKITKSLDAFDRYMVEKKIDNKDEISVFEASPVTPVKSFTNEIMTEAPGDPGDPATPTSAEEDDANDANDTATTNAPTTNDAPAENTDAPDTTPTVTSAEEDDAAGDEGVDGDDETTTDEDDAADDTTDDDTAEDEGGEEATTDEGNDDGTTDDADTGNVTTDEEAEKKFAFYRTFLHLYNTLDGFIDRLQNVVRNTPISNAVIRICTDKLTEIKDDMYDFMVSKYQDAPYYQIRNYFETCILAIQTVFELYRNNKITL